MVETDKIWSGLGHLRTKVIHHQGKGKTNGALYSLKNRVEIRKFRPNRIAEENRGYKMGQGKKRGTSKGWSINIAAIAT